MPPLGYSPTGEVFNLAWEDVAESVAVALRADKLLMYTDQLPADRKGDSDRASSPRRKRRRCFRKKTDLTPTDERARIEHAVRARRRPASARGHIVTRRADGSLLLELFTHTGVGTMITADDGREAAPGAHRGRAAACSR